MLRNAFLSFVSLFCWTDFVINFPFTCERLDTVTNPFSRQIIWKFQRNSRAEASKKLNYSEGNSMNHTLCKGAYKIQTDYWK